MGRPLEIALLLDRKAEDTLQEQLREQLQAAILDGRLEPGTRLPSTRSLSAQLEVSRNVVLAVYDELYAEGYVEAHHGSGTFVSPHLTTAQSDDSGTSSVPESRRWLSKSLDLETQWRRPPDDRNMIRFQLGRPSTDPLPAKLWRKLWREMAEQPPPISYGPPQGYLRLREAIAGYIGRSRGVACSPDSIVVTSGSLQALDLIGRATIDRGDPVGFEDPGYPVARANLRLNGADIVAVPVTGNGFDVEALESLERPPLLVYTTPSHQYPTGALMPIASRLALLEWARKHDALIIEDDYDSEFRYDGPPLPALSGLDEHGCTAYIGTFSKMIAPSIRVGYVVAPPPLLDRIIEIKRCTDFQTSWPLQVVMAGFIEEGSLEQHIRRMRRHYGEKRGRLGEILNELNGYARLQGHQAGLHAYLDIFKRIDAAEVLRRLSERGVWVESIAPYLVEPRKMNGILLGYGGLSLEEIETGASKIVQAVKEVACESGFRPDPA
ncbi:MAG: PLP-dependent aminotransferase family protein [Chloroflexota bacterium]